MPRISEKNADIVAALSSVDIGSRGRGRTPKSRYNGAAMNRWTVMLAVVLSAAAASPAAVQRYIARQDGDVVRLQDATTQTSVSIIPSVGDIAFEMTVKGQNVLRWPYTSVDEFKARPTLSGIPFLGPWANRLDEQAFYANGKRYAFDMEIGNIRGAIPIHGFVTTTDQWRVVHAKAGARSAWVTSRLEFFRQPMWMKQWPFAHTIEITHRLQDGVLEVQTKISNLSADPMPVAIGFHPYFQLTDSKRDEWTISVGARTHWLLAANKVPTGETEPIERVFPGPAAAALSEYNLDDVFGDLVRDRLGRATVTVTGKSQRLDVVLGAKYRAAVIYSPKAAAFICIEPMAGITDALNLAQKGLYKELQTIPAGGTWQESFWVRPSRF
jgi:aldose 1-epimerase